MNIATFQRFLGDGGALGTIREALPMFVDAGWGDLWGSGEKSQLGKRLAPVVVLLEYRAWHAE